MDHPQVDGVAAVRVFVADLERAVRFYTAALGLSVAGTDDRNWAWFQLRGSILLVEAVERESEEFDELVGRFLGVSLATGDIQRTHRHMVGLGVEFDAPPAKQFWGGWLAHFHDPDDNVVTLAQMR